MISGLDSLVLATSNRPIDDDLEDYAFSNHLDVFRGDANNVADRIVKCSMAYEADYFLRLNGDSPFLDPALLSEGVSKAREGNLDLITNLTGRTFPYGISLEVARVASLEKLLTTLSDFEKEHATACLYRSDAGLTVLEVTSRDNLDPSSRLTVDTEQDLKVFSSLMERLGPSWASASTAEIHGAYLAVQASRLN